MKNVKSIILLAGIMVAAHIMCTAGNPSKYEQAMLANIGKMYQSSTADGYLEYANTFARIAKAESDKWEPLYYQAYSYLMAGMMTAENDVKDSYFDKSLSLTNQGLKISANNAELILFRGWVYTMKITVDPATRGQEYSPMSFAEIHKALAIDPNNPRAMFLLARSNYGLAEFFGNDTSESCAQAQKAAELSASENPASPLTPNWQEYAIQDFLKLCNQ